MRADGCVFGSVVMRKAQAKVLGDDVEPMRQEMRPDPLSHLQAAEIGQFRIGLPIEIEACAPDAEIESSIVRDHGRPPEIVVELVHNLGKLGCVLDMLRPNAVNGDVHAGKPHFPRSDQTLLYAGHFTILDPCQTDRTGAAALFVGCFEVNGDGLQRGFRVDIFSPI